MGRVVGPRGGMNLIEGEDPRTEDVIDARHWQDVYRKLIEFTLRSVPEPPQSEPMLVERLQRYRGRLHFWSERVWELEDISIDQVNRTVGNWSGSIALTGREFQILKLLLDCPGRTFSARRLLLEAWHDATLPEEAVRSYIARLRRKLERIDLAIIVTNPSGGYRLEIQSKGRPNLARS